MAILYRLGQLWHNVSAQPLSQPEFDEISDDLNPNETTLFRQMSTSDQRHAFRVYRLLKESGHSDTDLLTAALLHDVGKVHANLSTWDRSLAVLIKTLAPQKAKQWGEEDNAGWKRGCVARERHAAWGAALATVAGSRPDVVDLIMRHQDGLPANGVGSDERLALLQWADDQN